MPDLSDPELFDVGVSGGDLRVGRYGAGPTPVLGLHGITGTLMQLAPVARHLPPHLALVAPDLRGRGASNHLGGPFGMRAHADDCAAVVSLVADAPVVVVGESMGAYVAVVLAARHPDLVARLVLVDGGLPLPVPPGVDVDQVMEAVLGPALERLGRVFPTTQSYLDFWRAHPALGACWNPDIEAALEYDLEPVEGGFRSRARPEAVRVDGSEHIVAPALVEEALSAVECPVTLLRAPRNLLDQPVPLLPDGAVAPWKARLEAFSEELVPDTNHYTICYGARGAARIARAAT